MINALPLEVLVQVMDTLPVRIFWKDRESRFLGCNQRFAADAGIADPREFVGKSDYFFYHPDQAAIFRGDDADVMFSGNPKLGILEKLTHANGQINWLETNKWPLRNDGGEIVGIIGMYVDVTDQKQIDDERCRACLSVLTAR
jgi:PAS domain S-box-containing protein